MEYYSSLFIRSLPLLLQGVFLTIEVVVCAAALSIVLGTCCGIFLAKRMRLRFLSPFIEGTTFLLRAIPFYVQLMIVYFVLPDLIGINLEPFPASVLALGICSSGYIAYYMRGGINSIPQNQWEGAQALGYTKMQTMRTIIMPQVLRHILPALNNEFEGLLKSSAIVSSIGLLELTRVGMNLVSREMDPISLYIFIAGLYVALSSLVLFAFRLMERRVYVAGE